ncbi:MAG: DUF4347 domain-containing protein [Spirulina sp. SIO3F2]|nr:DUF4347 domain-containing protein [Spirulina sp. SIO3F2]
MSNPVFCRTLAASSLMFIDASVADASFLLANVPAQVKPVVLARDAIALRTITQQLKAQVQATGRPVEAVHLVCHGAPGSLRLGQTHLSRDTLPQYATLLAQWRNYLSPDAELLLYSCQTASTTAGLALLDCLSLLTGAKVAASSTLVGNASLGGDWELDVQTAPMQGMVAFPAVVQEQYAGVFNQLLVTNTNDSGPGSLRQAILDANANANVSSGLQNIALDLQPPGSPRIIYLDTPLPEIITPINLSISFSAPLTLDGQNITEVANGLTISSGGTNISGISVVNFKGYGLEIKNKGRNSISRSAFGFDMTNQIPGGNSQAGIFINNTEQNTINSSIISQNDGVGIIVSGEGAIRNQIIGNNIGIDPFFSQARGNSGTGIRLEAGTNNNTLTENDISGNGGNGLEILGSNTQNNSIAFNNIGVHRKSVQNTTEYKDAGNGKHGILIQNAVENRVTNNLITDNSEHGIYIQSSQPSSNFRFYSISSNTIGKDESKNISSGNKGDGVRLEATSIEVSRNDIIGNQGDGVSVLQGEDNIINANRITQNGGLGINLGSDGITPNDPGDIDTGANGLQNKPVLTSARIEGEKLIVQGELQTKPNQLINLDLYLNTGEDSEEGEAFITLSPRVEIDNTGQAMFESSIRIVDLPLSEGHSITDAHITATATGESGTSEFSQSIAITSGSSSNNLPVVKLVSPETNTSEGGTPSIYRLERDDAQGELNVLFQVSPESTASPEDYSVSAPGLVPLSGGVYSITFAEGQTTVGIAVTAIDDDLIEGTETLTLALRESGSYEFDEGAHFGTVAIADNDSTDETAPNAAPINQLPTSSQSTTQGEDLIFSDETENLIAVYDADTDDELQLVLSIDGGTLTLANTEGLTFSTGDGQDDEELNLTGAQTAINQALDGLRFRPDADFVGQTQLNIVTNDQDSLNPQQDEDSLRFVVFPEAGSELPLVELYDGNWLGTNSPGGQTFKLTLQSQNTGGLNELGMFRVDDAEGTIEGIAPGESGYMAAAMARSRIVMSALSNFSDNLFPGLETTRHLTMEGNSFWGFYLVTGSTTDTIKGMIANGQTPSNLALGLPESGRLRIDESDGSFTLNFDDGLGSLDFDDFKLTLTPTFNLNPVIGNNLQDQNEGELIDLRDYEGFMTATFVNFSEAAYSNELGFYTIDNAAGAIDNLMPGDSGYAAAALARRVNFSTGFDGGKLFAPFMVANGTVSDFLSQNPTNQFHGEVHTYFAFMGANPDKIDHVRLLGDNTFAFEDLLGGGDFDYNDAVIQATFV